eukprot:symbB.v1.2.012751.t2/scaffold886.1/size155167/7
MSRSQVVALHTEASPLLATSPYHAFASAPPCALRKPKHWPGDEGSPSTVRLLWDDEALYVSWELHGDPVPPVQLKEDPMLEALTIRRFQVVHGFEFEDVLWVRNGDGILTTLPTEQRSLLFDERVECFLWQPISVAGADIGAVGEDELYFAFEINYGCKVLSNRAHFGGRFGFDWDSSQAFRVWSENISVGPEGDAALKPLSCRVVVGEFRWDVLRIDKSKEIRIGLHRAQHPQGVDTREMGKDDMDALLKGMIWTSWIDPEDTEVNFHRPEMFGKLLLKEGIQEDHSCAAARFLSAKALRILRSPIPRLEECPPGRHMSASEGVPDAHKVYTSSLQHGYNMLQQT